MKIFNCLSKERCSHRLSFSSFFFLSLFSLFVIHLWNFLYFLSCRIHHSFFDSLFFRHWLCEISSSFLSLYFLIKFFCLHAEVSIFCLCLLFFKQRQRCGNYVVSSCSSKRTLVLWVYTSGMLAPGSEALYYLYIIQFTRAICRNWTLYQIFIVLLH